MFTEMRKALEAEALELTSTGDHTIAAACRVVARRACGKEDLADLLGALGLPCDEDDLVRLLPHLTPNTPTPGDPMPVNAFTATAASMLTNGDTPDHVRDTLGLSDSELAEVLQHTDYDIPAPGTGTDAPQTARPAADSSVPAADSPVPGDGIEDLLSWAKAHPAAVIRNKAARVRSDLSELTARRASDDAQREAEERVAKLKAELDAAQEVLRTVKSGGRPATPATAPAPASTKRSKEELAAIRVWARAHGYQVASLGLPARAVLEAYDAAHTTSPAEAL
ncbi:hypothetical protein [Streptomyces sp. NPDC049916]|uniref:Lsr2 family DNA-binding protein n=1 Tax=Streptomyces sp. NPDC049916 TaxID=3155156 RepID=UPI00342C5A72